MLMKVFRISFLFCVAHLVMLYSLALASFQFPLDPYITESYFFGQPVGNEYHAGQDCDGTGGTPVYAISDGSISYSGTMGGYGWLITVDHSSDNVYSLYGHVSSRRWKKTSGTVNKGDLIGYLADNDEDGGNWGPHLHFGIRKGKRSDYPSSGYNRWMAGYTDKDPTLYNWYNPTNFIKDRVSKPDLAVSKLTINKIGSSPTQSLTLTPNEQFRIDAYIKNKGNGDVSKEFKIRYLRSSDKKFSSSDTNIGSDSISSLKAGDTKREDIIVNAPPTPGTYYIGAWADSGKVIDESDENNNFSDSDDEIGTIIVQEAPPPPQNNIPAIMMIINNLLLDDENIPNSVSSLIARSASSNSIKLIWKDNSTNETGFKIYRMAGISTWALLASVEAGTSSYIDNTATGNNANTQYSYYIEACNSSGCSTKTNTARVPFKPTNLIANSGLKGIIKLQWQDKSDNETGFEVHRKIGDCSSLSTWGKIKTLPSNSISFNNIELTSGSTYSYKIRAFTKSSDLPYSFGYSGWSNCVTRVVP